MSNTNFEKPEWYIISSNQNEPVGPLSMRDLDVKYRTGEISSTNTVHGWREGMTEWKVITDIPEIKEVL